MVERHPVTLAARLREARDAKGWTQTELAERAGVSQQVIGKIERGKARQPRYILEIAGALGVSPAWLMYGTDELDDLDEEAIALALSSMRMTEKERRALRQYVEESTKDAANQ